MPRRRVVPRRTLLGALVATLVGSALVAVLTGPSGAAGAITFSTSAAESTLVGGQVDRTLTASNPAAPGAEPQYNLSFREVLPLGVTYVPGSSAPATFGEPQVLTDPSGQQVLVWQNVSDLAISQTVELRFRAQLSAVGPHAHLVGDDVTLTAGAYSSSNPRYMPKFTATGDPAPGPTSYTASATGAATTTVTALTVTKTEPSPEGELLRGVHDHDTVYTLTVQNNTVDPTHGVTVTDFLPAQLEFLGCGTSDASAAVEYPGAPRLDVSTQDVPACVTPSSVTTVTTGLPAGASGVHTRVQWTIGNLAPGETRTITYRAGIPMRANVMPASPATFVSTANLDNNTGAATREGASETSVTNRVRAEGRYQGVTSDGSTDVLVGDTDTRVVTIEDLAVRKTASTSTFADSQAVTYTLTVVSGEYTDATDVVLTDQMQDGLCPLDDTTNHVPGPGADPACDPVAGRAPTGADYASVVDGGGDGFTVVFTPVAVPRNGTASVVYHARMRSTYEADAARTSAGDSFVNTVELTGTTTTLSAQLPPDPAGAVTVGDSSSHTIGSLGPALDKTIAANSTPMDCAAATYGQSAGPGALPAADLTYAEGDRVCFTLRVAFPVGSSTRDAVLTDFLPSGVAYETGSLVTTPASTLTAGDFTATETPDSVRLDIGTATAGHRYVAPGQVLEVRLAGIVQSDTTVAVDVAGNLAKLTWTDREGRSASARDQVDFTLPAPPPLALGKTVQQVSPVPSPEADSSSVRHGTVARFAVAITNQGTAALGSARTVRDLEVWDVLPAPLRCADVLPGSATVTGPGGVLTPDFTCTDPGAAGHPDVAGGATSSVLRWNVPAALRPAESSTDSLRLTYDVLVPTSTSVGVTYTNTAHVRTYLADTNRPGVTAPHFPAENVDRTVPADAIDTTVVRDTAALVMPAAGVTKTATTSVVEAGNAAAQAVPGELVTYVVRATVPARTTIYNGRLADPLPSNLTFVSGSAAYSATGASPAVDALPSGFTTSGTSTFVVQFPATWTNSTDTPQVIEATIVARVAPSYTQHAQTRTNTATLTSTSAAASTSTAVTPVTASAATSIVQPAPALAKTASISAPVAGQVVTYTLRASNASSRPSLHDTLVVDCVPAGLSIVPGSLPTEVVVAPDTTGCVTGTGTKLEWTVGSVTSSAPRQVTYQAVVSADAAGSQSYTNRAGLTGSTLADGGNTAATERVLTTTANAVVTLPGATITKALGTGSDRRVVGDLVTYSISTTFARDVAFYDATVLDTLPAGLDASSLTTTSVTCTYTDDGTPCASPAASETPLTPSGQTVGWFLGDLTSQPRVRQVTLTVTARVADVPGNQAGTVLPNTARVVWNLADRTNPTTVGATFDRAPEASNAVSTTVLEPQLGVAKSVSSPTAAPGDVLTYTVTATNQAGANRAPAHDVVITDVVPFGLAVDTASVTASGGSYNPLTRAITWTVAGPVAPGAASTFTYQARLADSSLVDTAARTNTVQVTSWTSLPGGGRAYPEAGDPTPTATATITPRFPRVVVDKTAPSGPSYVGAPTTFTVRVTNSGSATALGVVVTDDLPAGWSYQPASATVTSGGVAVAAEPDVAGDPQVLTWSTLAPAGLPAGGELLVTYAAVPSADALTDPGTTLPDGTAVPHTNTVEVQAVDATGADANAAGPYAGGPDSADAFLHSADLSVTKTGVGVPVAGQPYAWTVAVSNDGPDPAVGPITVTDTLPAAALLTGASATGEGWSCGAATTTITCTHPGPVAVDGTLPNITVRGSLPANVAPGTDLTNAVTAAGRTNDPDPTTNTSSTTTETTNDSDLAISKELVGELVAGQTATYTLGVANVGPSDSVGPITVTDTLPAGTTFRSATGEGVQCAEPTDGVLTCTWADGLALGDGFGITVAIDVPADRTADVVNTATVDGPDDTDADNNTATTTDTPVRRASLTVEKSLAGTEPVVAGDEGTYRLDVRNSGPSTATDVVITDTLPDYLTFVPTGSDATCAAVGQVVTCERPDALAVDGTWAIDLRVAVASGHTADVENTVSVVATEDPDGDTDEDANTPDLQSDLRIAKSHEGEVVAGGDVTYRVTVTNDGPSDEPGPLQVVDTVPTGMTFVSASGGGWTCAEDEGDVVCDRATGLVDGATTDVDLTFAVDPAAGPAELVNRVSVDGTNADPDPSDNVATDPTSILDRASVTVSKTALDASVVAGTTTTWRVVATNAGPSVADGVTVTDTLPPGLSLVSVAGEGWDCPADPPPGVFTCRLEALAPGESTPLTVVTQVGSAVADGSSLVNTVRVTTLTPGQPVADVTDADEVPVTTSADLELDKALAPEQSAVAGETVRWDLVLRNEGPSDAVGPLSITDTLPAGLTYVGADGPWACTAGPATDDGQVVTCTLPDVASLVAGSSAPPLTLTTALAPDTAGATLVNSASGAAAGTDDPDGAEDDATVTPTGEVDLAVTKSHVGPVRVGDPVAFTVGVSNAGPSEARSAQLVDALPDGLELVSLAGDGWTCDTDTVTCVLDEPLAPGAAASAVTVVATVLPGAYPEVENSVTVSAVEPDRDPSNDTAVDAVTVPPLVDLSLTKVLVGELAVGEPATYRLTVTNDGLTDDPGPVTVSDPLPAGLSFVEAAGEGWACEADDAAVVTCVAAEGLATETSSAIDLQVEVGAAAYPSVVNTASVSSPAEDPTADDLVASTTDPVTGRADLAIDKSLASLVDRTATWTITVTNAGPTETISPVTVTDSLPAGLEPISAEGDGWACQTAATITCEHPEALAVDASASITVVTRVTAAAGTTVTNVATVEGQGGDGASVSTAEDAAQVSLPSTGGPSWVLAALAALLLLAGAGVLRVRRRD